MPNASSFLKRGSPSIWPHELTVADDPDHPLFDDRMPLPVTDERIRNFAAVEVQVQADRRPRRGERPRQGRRPPAVEALHRYQPPRRRPHVQGEEPGDPGRHRPQQTNGPSPVHCRPMPERHEAAVRPLPR